LPEVRDGQTVYNIGEDDFSDYMVKLAESGASILGGCCGTTPEFIRKTIEKTRDLPYSYPEEKDFTLVSSYTHAVEIGDDPILIGERINPTGKPKLKEALRTGDLSYILNEAIKQSDAGAHILDVNVGLPEIDETEMMLKSVAAIQSVTDLPLQIDTTNAGTLSAAMRIYNGKPLVNSVNGTEESMKNVLPQATHKFFPFRRNDGGMLQLMISGYGTFNINIFQMKPAVLNQFQSLVCLTKNQ
jgi:5-methyltetrahydrofolate--homocysteine methyltransferase